MVQLRKKRLLLFLIQKEIPKGDPDDLLLAMPEDGGELVVALQDLLGCVIDKPDAGL
jgi:hypothetical protein